MDEYTPYSCRNDKINSCNITEIFCLKFYECLIFLQNFLIYFHGNLCKYLKLNNSNLINYVNLNV